MVSKVSKALNKSRNRTMGYCPCLNLNLSERQLLKLRVLLSVFLKLYRGLLTVTKKIISNKVQIN